MGAALVYSCSACDYKMFDACSADVEAHWRASHAVATTVADIERALPYGDFDREAGEEFLAWRRRFAVRIFSELAATSTEQRESPK